MKIESSETVKTPLVFAVSEPDKIITEYLIQRVTGHANFFKAAVAQKNLSSRHIYDQRRRWMAKVYLR